MKILQETKEDKTKYDRNNLKPIRIKTARKELLKKLVENQAIQAKELDKKVIEEEPRKPNKLILKPIEIKEPRKPTIINSKKDLINVSNKFNGTIQESPFIQKSFEKFSKTSEFKFKILENLQNNSDLSKLELEMNLKPGEISRNIFLLKNIMGMNNMGISNQFENLNHLSFLLNERGRDINLIDVKDYKIKLDEMITLNIFRDTKISGNHKKMLHAPSLKMYSVRVILF